MEEEPAQTHAVLTESGESNKPQKGIILLNNL